MVYYSNLKEMKEAFKDYMDDFLPKNSIFFKVGQYNRTAALNSLTKRKGAKSQRTLYEAFVLFCSLKTL